MPCRPASTFAAAALAKTLRLPLLTDDSSFGTGPIMLMSFTAVRPQAAVVPRAAKDQCE